MVEYKLVGMEDITALHDIEVKSFKNPWTFESLFHDVLNNEAATYYGVFEESRLIGYCGMWVIIDQAHMTNIALLPEQRHKGQGKAFLEYIIKQMYSKDILSISLEVRISNQPAISLYTACGFKIMGTRKNYYNDGEDAYIMLLTMI